MMKPWNHQHQIVWTVCLLAWSALGQTPAPQAAPAPAPVSNWRSTMPKPLKICVSPTSPMVYCTIGNNDTKSYTGFDVEMIRKLTQRLNLKEGTDYYFDCIPFLDIIESLKTREARCRNCDECSQCYTGCDMGVSGITITLQRQEEGIVFSYPYYKASLAVLVQATVGSSGGWNWIKPFTWDLWLAVCLTLIIFSIIAFLLEFLSLKRRLRWKDVPHGWHEGNWRSIWTFMHGERFEVSSIAARVAVGAFAFMALIVSSTYTANLAAFLTVQQINSAITSAADLKGKAVASTAIYLPRLRVRWGIVATDEKVQGDDTLRTVAQGVVNGEFAAFIWDEPVLRNLAANWPTCNINILPETIEPFDLGVAFRNGTNPAFIQQFSDGIQVLQDNGDLQLLRSNFVGGAGGKCDTGSANQSTTAISFMELYGLWIILAAAVCLGTLIMLLVRQRKSAKWRKKATLGRINSNASDRSSLGRTSTVNFAATFRRSFRSKSLTSPAAQGVTFDTKIVDLEAEAASGSGASDPALGEPGSGAGLPTTGAAVPTKNTPPSTETLPAEGSTGAAEQGTAYARLGSAVSHASGLTEQTDQSVSVLAEDVEGGACGGMEEEEGHESSSSSEDEEEHSDMQMLDSAFKGLSKKLTSGKCKTEGSHPRKGPK